LTGMTPGNTDVSEAAGGFGVNGFVAPLAVLQDQIYLVFIDNFDVTGQSFSLTWNLSQPNLLDCTVLPVDFINVQARSTRNSVLIEWSTGSEHNSDYFLIERSVDGVNFLPLGTVAAQGESSQIVEYDFMDSSPKNGVNFYRIKQVDFDGASKYSMVVSERFGRMSLIVTPNPANETAVLHVDQAIDPNAMLRITDARGRVVGEQRMILEGSTMPLDLAGLESGFYTISLYGEKGTPLGHTRFVKE